MEEEKIVITNRRVAKGRTKPLIFFSLQVILLELISFIFFNLFDTINIISLGFIAIIQIISFIVMIDSYKKVMARQKERVPKKSENTDTDAEENPKNETE